MSDTPTSDVTGEQELRQLLAMSGRGQAPGSEAIRFAGASVPGDTLSSLSGMPDGATTFGPGQFSGIELPGSIADLPSGFWSDAGRPGGGHGSIERSVPPAAARTAARPGNTEASLSPTGISTGAPQGGDTGATPGAPTGTMAAPGRFVATEPAAATGPTTIMVGTEAQLNQAIATVDDPNAAPGDYVIRLTGSITENTDGGASSTFDGGTIADPGQLFAFNLASGVDVTIDGQGNALSGAGVDPGLFVYAGNVTVENLAIDDAVATGGAGGNGGGGGGAGLGGGLFVASGGTVSLDGVTFNGDAAAGGDGGAYAPGQDGGGGGLGGSGGGGGGGGVGLGASGGSDGDGTGSGPGGAGIILGATGGGEGGDGTGSPAALGGAYGGGGGSSSYAGGGGGVDGGSGLSTADGGFGGGGGSGLGLSPDSGGFGGGGAPNGTGGFGGGGGGGLPESTGPESGGFGGGTGGGFESSTGPIYQPGGGGGGLGAGADVFVQQGGTLEIGSGTLGDGAVSGGSALAYDGGSAGQNGEAFGTGLFLQGDETVTLGSSGQPLTIDGTIADQTGNGGTGGNAGAGALDIASGSTVTLDAADSYTGGTTLGSGSTLVLGNGQAAGTGAITFGGTGGDLVLDAVVPNAIYGFGAPNAIDLADVPIADYIFDAYTFSTDDLQIVESDEAIVNLDVHGITPSNFSDIQIVSDGHGGTLIEAPCFVVGTALDTPDGSIRVEALQVGDVVSTLSGPARVRWIGHRRATGVDVIRVRAHAFGENRPRRDLCVSDDHAMFVDGVLVPAGLLVDGSTIVAERRESVVFFHVELDAHAILLAEGAPAESYIDTGNRRQFGNCPIGYDPVGATQDHCAELVLAGSRLEAIRARLASVPA